MAFLNLKVCSGSLLSELMKLFSAVPSSRHQNLFSLSRVPLTKLFISSSLACIRILICHNFLSCHNPILGIYSITAPDGADPCVHLTPLSQPTSHGRPLIQGQSAGTSQQAISSPRKLGNSSKEAVGATHERYCT